MLIAIIILFILTATNIALFLYFISLWNKNIKKISDFAIITEKRLEAIEGKIRLYE